MISPHGRAAIDLAPRLKVLWMNFHLLARTRDGQYSPLGGY